MLLLIQTKRFQATDLRDKAYAVLSMLKDTDFRVDYKETVEEVAQRVSVFLLTQTSSRNIQGPLMLYHSVGVQTSGCSWAFDLANVSPVDPLVDMLDPFGAADPWKAGITIETMGASIEGPSLTVNAFTLGCVTNTTAIFPVFQSMSESPYKSLAGRAENA